MRKSTIFIVAFLAAQMLLPLHYYVLRQDKNDERFAWRMFSPRRSLKCNPADFRVDGKRVSLLREVDHRWEKWARRARHIIIRALARKLCRDNPDSEVSVSLECKHVDGTTESYGGSYDFCFVDSL